MNANFLNLKLSDFWKGLIVAVIGSILTAVYTALNSGVFPQTWLEWKTILLAGVGSGIAYLLKNLFTNSNGNFGKVEPPKDNG